MSRSTSNFDRGIRFEMEEPANRRLARRSPRALVLSQGIVGDSGGIPKVACPVHKKPFALRDGRCLYGEDYALATFPVRVESGQVYLELPREEVLDPVYGTAVVRVNAHAA